MNKGLSVLAGIVILLIVGVLAWLSVSSRDTMQKTPQREEAASRETSSPAGPPKSPAQGGGGTKNTFGAIFAQAGSHECKYAYVDGSAQHNNVIYITDGKMRGEFRTVGEVADLMVFDGTYLYAWREGKATGSKTRLSSIADLPKAIPKDLTSAAVFGTSLINVSWDCHAWIKDAKLLVAPSYVRF